MNKVELNESVWLYAIHGQNPDIIHFIEEQKNQPNNSLLKGVFIESIKCHHNAISEYIVNNYFNDDSILNDSQIFFKYYNFLYFPAEINNGLDTFYNMCKYDYASIVDLFLNDTKLNINYVNEILIHFLNLYLDSVRIDLYRTEEITNNIYFNKKPPLSIAVEKGNLKIVKLLLKHKDIDVNIQSIFNDFFINDI